MCPGGLRLSGVAALAWRHASQMSMRLFHIPISINACYLKQAHQFTHSIAS